jgi:hypothetical protein
MSSVSSNILPFSAGLILVIRESLLDTNQESMEGDLILESLVLPKKTALLLMKYDFSRCHARGTSFLFPDTEVLLDEFFKPNETILYLPSS